MLFFKKNKVGTIEYYNTHRESIYTQYALSHTCTYYYEYIKIDTQQQYDEEKNTQFFNFLKLVKVRSSLGVDSL